MMKEETPKQRTWSKELYEKASEFHGHGGPFMIVGLRMGLLGIRLWDMRGKFENQRRGDVV